MNFELIDRTFHTSLKQFCLIAIKDVAVSVTMMNVKRWSDIRAARAYREDDLKLKFPILLYSRTGESEDPSYRPFNEYHSNEIYREWTVDNPYDSYSLGNNIRPAQKVHTIMFPKYYKINYECIFITTHMADADSLKSSMMMHNPSYWGSRTDGGPLILANVGSFSNQITNGDGTDRLVKISFPVEITAPILPDETQIGESVKVTKTISNTVVITETTVIPDNPKLRQQ